ncbi:MAG: hypothetical protein JW969_05300 [Spirochaetales bacterium]|nr:hypothetical protein [Spirochaetales bacterium]
MELNEQRRKLRGLSLFSYFLKLLFIALPIIFILVGYNASPMYYFGILSAAIPILGVWFLRKSINQLKKDVFIKRHWGGDYVDENFGHDRGRCYFDHNRHSFRSVIDEQTCNDLNLHKLYEEMNLALTVPGKNMLYSLLRTPLVDIDELRERDNLIGKFQNDVPFRERILSILLDAYEIKNDYITNFLWNKTPPRDPMFLWYKSLAFISICTLFTPFLLGPFTGIVMIILMFIINLVLHTRKSKSLDSYLPAFSYLRKFLKSARQLARDPEIAGIKGFESLADETGHTDRIIKSSRLFSFSPGMATDMLEQIFIYVRIFFLIDLNNYNNCIAEIDLQKEHIRKIYEIYGYLDAVQTIASFRDYIKKYARPVFIKGSRRIESKDMYYPLLTDPVSNSVLIENHGMIVTGTNMAGKSTFLRTVGLNCLLAQTCLMCFAASYESGVFFIMSSIDKRDDVTAGVSFYYHEAKRIFDMLTANTGDVPLLCLIDELLSGTNSLERVSASIAILKYLKMHNALVIAATHDVKIASLLTEDYLPCFFTDTVEDKGLTFNYKLNPGIVETTNAIRLLEHIGYPDSIIRQALELKKESE